jgi:putative spermidine/putrescine transport system substrate-binding protein
MKSKWFVLVSLVALTSLMLSACGATAGGSNMKTEVGQGEGEVSIISWAGYIERGDTDPAYDWVTEFETQTSCKVTNKVAATSDEMVTLMNEGGFDLVTASGDAQTASSPRAKFSQLTLSLSPRGAQ